MFCHSTSLTDEIKVLMHVWATEWRSKTKSSIPIDPSFSPVFARWLSRLLSFTFCRRDLDCNGGGKPLPPSLTYLCLNRRKTLMQEACAMMHFLQAATKGSEQKKTTQCGCKSLECSLGLLKSEQRFHSCCLSRTWPLQEVSHLLPVPISHFGRRIKSWSLVLFPFL